MASFGEGLLSGFEFVDDVRDRRARREEGALRRRQIEHSMNLQSLAQDRLMAQDRRAQAQFDAGMEDRQRLISRQADLDRSNELLALAQTRDLTPEENDEFLAVADTNPAALEYLAGRREQRELEDAAMSLANRPRALSDIATAPLGAQQQSSPALSDEVLAQQDEALLRGEEGRLPGALPGVRQVRLRDVLSFAPNLSPEQKAAFGVDPSRPESFDPGRRVSVPANFVTPAEMKDMPLPEQQRIRDQQRALLGDFRANMGQARDNVRTAERLNERWSAVLDPRNDDGSEFRRLASSDPVTFTNELGQAWNTLDPNLHGSLAREFQPVVNEAVTQTQERMRSAITNSMREDGTIDTTTPEFRSAKRTFDRSIAVMEQVDQGFSRQVEAQIRGGAFPVGTPQVVENLSALVEEAPQPARPPSGDQLRAWQAQVSRASGQRRVTTPQVKAAVKLVQHGLATPTMFVNLLETGSFVEPGAEELKYHSHDPQDDLWVNGQLVYKGTRETTGEGVVGEDFQGIVDEFFTGHLPNDAPAWQKQEARSTISSFYRTLVDHQDELFGGEIDVQRLDQLSRPEIEGLMARYQMFVDTRNKYEEGRWFWQPHFGERADFSDFDAIARKLRVGSPPPMPSAVAAPGQVQQARIALANSPDRTQRLAAKLLMDHELAREIELAASQGGR